MENNKCRNLEKIHKRFEEFMNTYPEEMRYKVSPGNCLVLMEWAYKEAQKDTLEEVLRINKGNDIGWNETVEIIVDKLEELDK